MKKSILVFVLLVSGFIQAQENGVIEGIVLDKQMNNEPLAFTNVTLKKAKLSTTANIDGAYALEVKPGTYTLVFNFPGYKKVETSNVIVKAGEITSIKNITLEIRQLVLSEVVVTHKKEK